MIIHRNKIIRGKKMQATEIYELGKKAYNGNQ
jgi:hypothetical protein